MLTYLLKYFFKAVTNKNTGINSKNKASKICPIAILPLDFQFQHLLKGILIIEGEGIQIRIDEIKNIQSFYPLIILKHQALVNHQL
jgi:hypothetical protein